MFALLEDQEFGGTARLSQGQVKQDAVFRWNTGIAGGVNEKSGRRVLRHLQIRREFLHQFFAGIGAHQVVARSGMGVFGVHADDGIDQHEEIRARADPFDGVFCVRVARFEQGSGAGGEVAAGGKPEHADACGIDSPFAGPGAHGAQGAARVHEGNGVGVVRGMAVLKHESGDAVRNKPLADFLAFVTQGEISVAATGAHYNSGARGRFRRGKIRGQRGRVPVAGPLAFGRTLRPQKKGFSCQSRCCKDVTRTENGTHPQQYHHERPPLNVNVATKRYRMNWLFRNHVSSQSPPLLFHPVPAATHGLFETRGLLGAFEDIGGGEQNGNDVLLAVESTGAAIGIGNRA